MRTPGDRQGVKSATGRWIVTANYGAGSVGLVPIEKDGTLGPRSDRELKEVFRRYRSQPIERVINLINPVLRGWVNYFAVGHSSECFSGQPNLCSLPQLPLHPPSG